MMSEQDVERVLRDVLAGAPSADPGPCPEPDALAAYHERTLEPGEHDRVQAHLALCSGCAQAVADFAVFPHLDAPSDLEYPSAEDDARGLQAVEAAAAAGLTSVPRCGSSQPEADDLESVPQGRAVPLLVVVVVAFVVLALLVVVLLE